MNIQKQNTHVRVTVLSNIFFHFRFFFCLHFLRFFTVFYTKHNIVDKRIFFKKTKKGFVIIKLNSSIFFRLKIYEKQNIYRTKLSIKNQSMGNDRRAHVKRLSLRWLR